MEVRIKYRLIICGLLVGITAIAALKVGFHVSGETRDGEAVDSRNDSGAPSGKSHHAVLSSSEAPLDASDKINKNNYPTDLRSAIARMAEIDKDPNISSREIKLSNLISQMCAAGLFKEACDLIESHGGEIRESQIERLTNAESVPILDRIGFLKTLADPRDQAAGCKGLIDSLTTRQILDLNVSTLNLASESLISKIHHAIGEELRQDMEYLQEDRPNGAEFLLDEIVNASVPKLLANEMNMRQFEEILEKDTNRTSFEHWDRLSPLTEFQDPLFNRVKEHLLYNMISSDATKAMIKATELAAKVPSTEAIEKGIKIWYRLDSKGANEWLQENFNQLPQLQKDKIAATASQTALIDGDRQTATRWAESISEPVLKQKVLSNLVNEQVIK